MGDRPGSLQNVQKTLRGFVIPLLIGSIFKGAIKGGVDLHRREVSCVVVEPAALGQIGRVKISFPVVIGPAGCANQELLSSLHKYIIQSREWPGSVAVVKFFDRGGADADNVDLA